MKLSSFETNVGLRPHHRVFFSFCVSMCVCVCVCVLVGGGVVSFAAVIRVVTRHATLLPISGEERCVTSDDPNNGCEGD